MVFSQDECISAYHQQENDECFYITYLQKSGYGNFYSLYYPICIKGAFKKIYEPQTASKLYLGSLAVGKVLSHHTMQMLDLEKEMNDADRERELREVFTKCIVPFTEKHFTKQAILEGYQTKEIFLADHVVEELKRLMKEEAQKHE